MRAEALAVQARALAHILDTLGRVAQTRVPVLFLGPRSDGLELLARVLHKASSRGDKAFVTAHCGLFPQAILERKLLGEAKSPSAGSSGLIRAAQGGTLFVEQIQNTSLLLQDKLEALLVESAMEAGAALPDVRLVASAGVDLEQFINTAQFRAGLYYKIGMVPIKIPRKLATRKRILEVFMELHKRINVPSPETGSAETTHAAFAEIKVLEDVLRRVESSPSESSLDSLVCECIKAYGPQAREETTRRHLEAISSVAQDCVQAYPFFGGQLYETLVGQFQRAIIERVLVQCNGIRSRAANMLGVSVAVLEEKLKELNLDRNHIQAISRLGLR